LNIIVPESAPVKSVGSNGEGYIIQDPVTGAGAGAYRIIRGLNGGEDQRPCAEKELKPLSQAIADNLKTLALLLLLAAVIIVIVSGSG
jgi:hypothetical protein